MTLAGEPLLHGLSHRDAGQYWITQDYGALKVVDEQGKIAECVPNLRMGCYMTGGYLVQAKLRGIEAYVYFYLPADLRRRICKGSVHDRGCGVAKRFGSHVALEDVSLSVENGMVYGLVGYNGAGKTTLLKIIAGVYKPDAGTVRIDGVPMHDDRLSHDSLFIVADEPYFLPQATPETMRSFYRGYYPCWSDDVYERMLALFELDPTAKVRVLERHAAAAGHPAGVCHWGAHHAFGRKLRRAGPGKAQPAQAASEGVCAGAGRFGYLASHNLRELEDAADHLGMIKGCHLTFDDSVAEVHKQYPGSSLEEIFLSEGGNKVEDIDGVFA